MASLHYVRL